MPYDAIENRKKIDAVRAELMDVLRSGRRVGLDHPLLPRPMSREDQVRYRTTDPWGFWCDDLAAQVAHNSAHFHRDEYGRADVGETALFAAQLKYYIAEFFGEHYPMTACRSWLTVDNSIPVGAREVSARRILRHGRMKAVAAYGKDAPVLTVGAAEDVYRNVEYQGKIVYTLAQLEHCAYAGFPLEMEELNTLAMAAEQNFEQVWHVGDNDYGTLGFYNGAATTSIPLYVVTTGTWATATHDQIVVDVGNLLYGIMTATNVEMLQADTLVVPASLWQYMGVRRTNTDLSVMEALKQEYPGLKIVKSVLANLLDATLTGPRLLAFASTRMACRFGEPRPLETLPAQQVGAAFESIGRQNLCGAILPQPIAFGHMDGC